jgi:hypothetical protein
MLTVFQKKLLITDTLRVSSTSPNFYKIMTNDYNDQGPSEWTKESLFLSLKVLDVVIVVCRSAIFISHVNLSIFLKSFPTFRAYIIPHSLQFHLL